MSASSTTIPAVSTGAAVVGTTATSTAAAASTTAAVSGPTAMAGTVETAVAGTSPAGTTGGDEFTPFIARFGPASDNKSLQFGGSTAIPSAASSIPFAVAPNFSQPPPPPPPPPSQSRFALHAKRKRGASQPPLTSAGLGSSSGSVDVLINAPYAFGGGATGPESYAPVPFHFEQTIPPDPFSQLLSEAQSLRAERAQLMQVLQARTNELNLLRFHYNRQSEALASALTIPNEVEQLRSAYAEARVSADADADEDADADADRKLREQLEGQIKQLTGENQTLRDSVAALTVELRTVRTDLLALKSELAVVSAQYAEDRKRVAIGQVAYELDKALCVHLLGQRSGELDDEHSPFDRATIRDFIHKATVVDECKADHNIMYRWNAVQSQLIRAGQFKSWDAFLKSLSGLKKFRIGDAHLRDGERAVRADALRVYGQMINDHRLAADFQKLVVTLGTFTNAAYPLLAHAPPAVAAAAGRGAAVNAPAAPANAPTAAAKDSKSATK